MGLAKKFGDWTVDEYVPQYTDDEYESLIEYKSNTVLVNALPFATALVGIVMAWFLPGLLSWLSILIYAPMGIAYMVADSWMKNYAPRPKPVLPKKYTAILIIAMALHMLLIFRSLSTVLEIESSSKGTVDLVSFMLIIVCAVFGAYLALKAMTYNRKADQKRFDAEAED